MCVFVCVGALKILFMDNISRFIDTLLLLLLLDVSLVCPVAVPGGRLPLRLCWGRRGRG